MFFIEWAATPTSYNRTQLMRVDSLQNYIERTSSGVQFTNNALINLGMFGHVIFKIYDDWAGVRRVYYKDGGYGPNHVSPDLDSMIKPEPKEELA